LFLKLGVFNKGNDNEPGEQVVGISEIHVHPKFDGYNFNYDVALMKLKTPITYTDHISPVCLPSELQEKTPVAGSSVFLTGWGITEKYFPSNTLKQVAVPLRTKENCKPAYPGELDEESQFCAGNDKGNKGACLFDSGGPVVFQDAANNGTWKQIGIISLGNNCGGFPDEHSVYSKISASLDFIKQYVKDL